jgi:hypothetical protein
MATQLDTAATLATGQVTVTNAAAVQVRPVNANRTKLTISSSVPIFLADSSGGAATGYPPFGTNNGGFNYDLPTEDAVYAQACGAPGVVYFAEFHN